MKKDIQLLILPLYIVEVFFLLELKRRSKIFSSVSGNWDVYSRLERIISDDTLWVRKRAALLRTFLELTAHYQTQCAQITQEPNPSQQKVPTDPRFQASVSGNVGSLLPLSSTPVSNSTFR